MPGRQAIFGKAMMVYHTRYNASKGSTGGAAQRGNATHAFPHYLVRGLNSQEGLAEGYSLEKSARRLTTAPV
ncbi:hypothetical protein LZ31DRAFT_553345 [Colletotrichum somersetense]|nr:hypothetical protein LZ31DRAFT_553345 [Colletotrichum somersetense]